MKPIIIVTHAAFDPVRQASLERLLASLLPCPYQVHIQRDELREGSLATWLKACAFALGTDATHVVRLPDDATVTPGFSEQLPRFCTDYVVDLFPNHTLAAKWLAEGAEGYWTQDGCVGFTVFPRELLSEHIAWRIKNIVRHAGDDEGVNLWCIKTGREVFKPLPGMVNHDTSVPSLDGHDHHEMREPAVPPGIPASTGVVVTAPDTYARTWWNTIHKLRPDTWDIEAVYQHYRPGKLPVDKSPHVYIATPSYGGIEAEFVNSRERVAEDLLSHGIGVSTNLNRGDSFILRGRNRMVHAFLKSTATHLLFWDADVEVTDPTMVRQMLARQRDVIAGAYPFKKLGETVVMNLLPEQRETQELRAEDGCVEVLDAPTGFMLIKREAILRLMQSNPELLHHSVSSGDTFEPLWALFSTSIEDDGQYRIQLSEDYFFCRLWQKHGGKVFVYIPARFKHYGTHAFTGTVEESFGLVPA